MSRAGEHPVKALRGLYLVTLVVFLWNVQRYVAFLIDDAYISLRYARNWVEGHGLVFNPTEVVEGYTNFLWTVLGALGLWLGLDGMIWWKTLSAISGLVLLWVVVRLSRHTVGSPRAVVVSPLLFLLGLEAFGYWLTTGMESLFYATLFNLAIYLALRESALRESADTDKCLAPVSEGSDINLAPVSEDPDKCLAPASEGSDINLAPVSEDPDKCLAPASEGSDINLAPSPDINLAPDSQPSNINLAPSSDINLAPQRAPQWLSSTWVFIALALTRPEGVMVFALVHGVIWLTLERNRRSILSHVRDGLLFAGVYGIYFLWRLSYYGHLFPNTYYAKVTGGPEQWTNGFINLGQWATSQPVLAAALVAPVALFARARNRRRFRRLLAVWWICCAYTAYVVSVGGDFMPFFRFFLPLMPPLTVLTVACLSAWVPSPRARVAVAGLLLALQWTTAVFDQQTYRAFVAHRTTIVGQDVGKFFRQTLEPGQWMGVNTVGSLPYESRLPTIDGLGLTDAAIARHPVYVISPLWSAHRRGWGQYMRRRRPQVIVWYNSAGLREPHYLGDRQLADDPYFRFFYQRHTQVLPARDPGRVLERFRGTPFGEPSADGQAPRSPELGLRFEVRRSPWLHTVVYEAPVELNYFALRGDTDALWPMVDEEADQPLRLFLDRVSSLWRRQAETGDPTARARVEAICERARRLHGQGDVAGAKRLLSQAAPLNRAARSPLLPHYVANIAVAERDLFLAVQAQREALRLQPDHPLYLKNLIHLLTVDYEEFRNGGRATT